MSGRLFVVATPIGNLSDISKRLGDILNQCDFVLAEDTRVSIKILNHLGIKKRLVSCHEFNENARAGLLEEASANNGTVAILADAGTPLISDPGYQIVRKALQLNMTVVPIPGPSAFLLALVGSGLPCDRFVFEGFLPDKLGAMTRRLQELSSDSRTMVFYISPHSLAKNLDAMIATLGDRPACLARELTKLHEEFIRAPLSAIRDRIREQGVLGELVLVVGGAPEDLRSRKLDTEEVRALVRDEVAAGLSPKDISRRLADTTGWKKSEIYAIAVEQKGKSSEEKIDDEL